MHNGKGRATLSKKKKKLLYHFLFLNKPYWFTPKQNDFVNLQKELTTISTTDVALSQASMPESQKELEYGTKVEPALARESLLRFVFYYC